MNKSKMSRRPKTPKLFKKHCIIQEDQSLIFVDSFKQNHFIKYLTPTSEIKIFEDNEVNRREVIGKKLMESSKRIEFDIFFGFVNLIHGKYAIFVRKSEFVGFLMMKQSVWRAVDFEIRKIGTGTLSSSHSTQRTDEKHLYLLRKLFKTKSFYFSHYFDLTNNLQTFVSQINLSPNSRFFVNERRLTQTSSSRTSATTHNSPTTATSG